MPIISPKIPLGLEELMRGLAKSVIKENPQNIYEFAAEYFENLLKERDGSVDQTYKKFATYKVYKKNKAERLKRGKENSNDVNERPSDNGLVKDEVNYRNQKSFDKNVSSEEKSVEEVILPATSLPLLTKTQSSSIAESGSEALINNETSEKVEGVPSETENQDDDDIANMVLDKDMEHAALKIQSTFRGHKVRREIKENTPENVEDIKENVDEHEVQGFVAIDDIKENIDEEEVQSSVVVDDIETSQLSENELDSAESLIDQNQIEENEQTLDSHDAKENIESEVDDDIANMVSDEDMEVGDENASIEEEKTEENLIEETLNQPDESKVAQSDEPDNVEINVETLNDGAGKQGNLLTEQSVHDDEQAEKEDIDEQKVENESKIDIVEETVAEVTKEENISPEMTAGSVEPDTPEGVIDAEPQNEDGKMVSDEAHDKTEKQDEIFNFNDEGVTDDNLNDQPEILVKNATETSEPLKQFVEDAAENADNAQEFPNSSENCEKAEVKEQEPEEILNEISNETKNSSKDEAETVEILPNIESEEIENKEIDEEDKLKTEDDLEVTAVALQDTAEEIIPEDKDSLLPDAEEKNADENVMEMPENKSINESNLVDTTIEENDKIDITLNEEEIKLTESIVSPKPDEETAEEKEICDNNLEENEPIKEIKVKVSEQETQQEELKEQLNESENEIVGDIEAMKMLDNIDDDDDRIPVDEEICVKKSIGSLEPDQENIESEVNENLVEEKLSNEIENLEDNQEKLPAGDIEYSTLRESISEPGESADEIDNKSRDVTDEKSIDGDTTGSRQNSLDEIQDEINEQSVLEGSQEESIIHPSTAVDKDEMNAAQQSEKFHKGLDEAAVIESDAFESIVQDISPIDLIDEVVNEYAGTVASELFNDNIEELEQEKGLIKSVEKEEENNSNDETIQPRLSEENPLSEIETPSSIDLTQETVQVSQDEQQPITDEILQPDNEESEIPEETQLPIDENAPTAFSAEEKTPSVENDFKQPDDEEDSPKPPKVEDDVSDMILDEEMEGAALKIQATFRGHQVRKEHDTQQKSETVEEEESENVKTKVVIDQCSDENQETEEQGETDQQDTSADFEQIQESETVDEEQTEEETHEEENTEEETAIESVENDTTEQGEDDPNGTPEEGAAESSEQAQNNDDDDVANMVLDEEMEQAALKIQSTFRGHKTRQDMKKPDPEGEASTSEEPEKQKDPVQDVDDEIANMVLDDEMEQAALKIQSTFRGHKSRKDTKKDDENDNEDNEEKPEEKVEDEPLKEEETSQSSSTEKTAKQLQEEEDIANLVMDAEMEQTALKIQSAFRGKSRKKATKDGNDSSAISADDQSDEEDEENPSKTGDDPFKQNKMSQEVISNGEKSYDEKGSENSATQYSPSDDVRYSIEGQNTSGEYDDIAPLNAFTEDLNLMQGGGIFPEPSGESSEMLTGSSGDDRDPERNTSYKIVPTDNFHETDEPISQQKSVDPLNDEEVIDNFDFVANKDTAEAMYYTLKKNELDTQEKLSVENQLSLETQLTEEEPTLTLETMTNFGNQSVEEDDDDVVMATMQPLSAKRLKYGMSMDERLLGSILSQDYSTKPRKQGYPDDGFDPLLEATMRNHHFLEKLHEISNSDEDKNMPYDDYPGDDEDQFDGFYNSNDIRRKIMASSISIADSDFFDHTNNKSIIDDDKIRTAIDKLETIPSSDSESTIASAATKIHAGGRMNVGRNITSHNMQYSSIGNAAIDKSLDEFIQSQELRIDRFDEEFEGYNSPPPRREESIDDWTDDTATYTDSDKKVGSGGIIEIKLEQKSFLTVDERRRTLHREDAIQRNSTREDEDSSKSSNVSGEKLLEKSSSAVNLALESEIPSIAQQDSVIDTEITVPVIDLTVKPKSSCLAQVKPQRMKRQHTMPVQIQTDVIRVIPKHLRKRIKSADDDKKRKVSK